jgi:hypothetical protein
VLVVVMLDDMDVDVGAVEVVDVGEVDVGEADVELVDVEADDEVVVDVPAASPAACVWARVAAASASADGRNFLIAWPRLMGPVLPDVVVVPLVVPPVDDVAPVAVVPPVVDPPVVALPAVPAGGVPSMAAFKSAKGMFRFFETCSAARNWP